MKSFRERMQSKSWRRFLIAVPIVLIGLLLVGKFAGDGRRFHTLLVQCLAFFMGWLTAVIAHFIYPDD